MKKTFCTFYFLCRRVVLDCTHDQEPHSVHRFHTHRAGDAVFESIFQLHCARILRTVGLHGNSACFKRQFSSLNVFFFLFLQFWTVFDLAVYSVFVCKEICDYLRVYLFYITVTASNTKMSGKMTSGSSGKNGSNSSGGLYQPHVKYPSSSTMTSFIYPSKTKTKY